MRRSVCLLLMLILAAALAACAPSGGSNSESSAPESASSSAESTSSAPETAEPTIPKDYMSDKRFRTEGAVIGVSIEPPAEAFGVEYAVRYALFIGEERFDVEFYEPADRLTVYWLWKRGLELLSFDPIAKTAVLGDGYITHILDFAGREGRAEHDLAAVCAGEPVAVGADGEARAYILRTEEGFIWDELVLETAAGRRRVQTLGEVQNVFFNGAGELVLRDTLGLSACGADGERYAPLERFYGGAQPPAGEPWLMNCAPDGAGGALLLCTDYPADPMETAGTPMYILRYSAAWELLGRVDTGLIAAYKYGVPERFEISAADGVLEVFKWGGDGKKLVRFRQAL